MKTFALVAATLVATSCKTPSNSQVKTSELESGELHCRFVTPDGSGDMVEVWATPAGKAQLTGVKSRITSGRNGAGPINPVATTSLVDVKTMTKGGKQGLRTYSKNYADINFKTFACFAVAAGSPGQTGYFCLSSQAKDREGNNALWVTDFSRQKFVNELTVYGAKCAG